MSHEKGYGGIDRFRIAAAVLVVAIHTLPLRMFGVLPHVVLSGIITRLGVPFFLAATGFFLLTPFADNPRSDPRRIGRFALKAAVLYAVCIIIYLPVNLYAGHFADISSVWQALKMALVDGTMYHLWYLPAVILAVPLVWALLRFTPLKITAAAVIFLYIIGLFGDSYYGLSASAPFFKGFYQVVFTVSDYTRSGLFYAPVFLLAGVCASRLQSMPRKKSGTGFLVSFALMLAEGLILHFADIQRHDSMYIMLPACTLFLLIWLSSFNGASKRSLRSVSMLVYIIHPGAIVLIRGAAKLTGLEHPLIDNSLIHFAAVCTLSFAAAAALAVLANAFKALKAPLQRRAWVEIDLGALSHNVRTLKSLLPPDCKLMPAVKADAYGFGAARISKELNRLGVRDFCVASPAEGIELRKCGIRGNILILGYTHPDDCRLIKRYRLVQTVVDNRHGALLAEKNMDMPVHIKLDTGMRRLGERIEHTDKIAELFGLAGIKICGIYTQFPCSDSALPQDIEQTRAQLGSFEAVLEGLSSRGIDLPKRHMQCSYGIINYPDIRADYARPGLALYGIVDERRCIGPPPDLRPIFAVRARVALVREVYEGEHIGYGTIFTAPSDMLVAAISIGFADGLPRSLSNGAGHVLIHGECAPIVGNICMDQTMVDITHIRDVKAGDVVTVIGASGGGEISVTRFAEQAGTIPNEIVSRLGRRLDREYTD